MESLELMPARVRIAAILKKAILSGEYQSGQELSLTDIAVRLGVSRTPVREAFQSLAADGLIELRMNRGAVVKPIDAKFITDHYDMRILLEGEAAARAARNGMDVSGLLAEAHHMQDNVSVTERSAYSELNQRLHASIWKAADNQKLYAFLENLWNGPSTAAADSELEHYRRSTEEHIRILEAIRAGDAETSRSIMRSHIERSRDNIVKSFRFTHTET